jgi:hypothetical protein
VIQKLTPVPFARLKPSETQCCEAAHPTYPSVSPGGIPDTPRIVQRIETWESVSDLNMKAILYAQLNPSKTMKQLIQDRNLYRCVIVASLFLAWCL